MYSSRVVRWGDTTATRPFAEELLNHLGTYHSLLKAAAAVRKAIRLVFANLPAEALHVIMERKLPGITDDTISAFVRDAVAVAAPQTAYSAYLLTTTASRYVMWCVKAKGWPLNPKVIWAVRNIDHYTVTANRGVTEATRGNYKGQLMRISEVLLPEQHPRTTPINKGRGPGAYSPAEMETYRNWPSLQLTQLKHDRAMLMMVLCAGAGIRPREMARLHHEHVTVDELGIIISVPGDDARDVPLLAEWEPWMTVLLKRLPTDERLWGPQTRGGIDNLTSAFTERSNGRPPRADRLRYTWLVHHLNLGTPLKELTRAAGIEKWQHLHRLLEDVSDRSDTEYRRLLRGEDQA